MTAPLTVRSVTPLPTLRCVVDFEPVTPAPADYTVTATVGSGGTAVTYTATGAATPITIGPVDHGSVMSIVVTAGAASGTPYAYTLSVDTSYAAIVRQRLAEIISAAGISGLRVVSDVYGRPRLIGKHDAFTTNQTLCEISTPRLTGSSFNGSREVDRFEFTIGLVEFTADEDTASDKLWRLLAAVRAAVNATANLGLYGVIDKSWEWSKAEIVPEIDQQYVELDATLSIPIQISVPAPY